MHGRRSSYIYIWAVLEWLIVGGGVQGSYLSHVLTARMGVARDSLRVIDPHPDPLARWQQTTQACGMRFLRSPAAHHIGLSTNELLDFARARSRNWQREFLQPYLRPSLELWNAHAKHVLETHRLAELRIQGQVTGITRLPSGYCVSSSAGELRSRSVILALGNSQPLHYPALPDGQPLNDERIMHMYDPRFSPAMIRPGERVAIIGSGVSAAQLAISLVSAADNEVLILTDRMPVLSWFDSDPGWNGPRLLERLRAIADMEERQRIVGGARIRGSFPGDTAASLLACSMQGRLAIKHGSLLGILRNGGELQLDLGEDILSTDRVILATGFSTEPPSGPLLDRISKVLDLPRSSQGWPVVNGNCEWSSGLYLSGALAQLELGPVARNISGVRSFARILASET